MRKLFSLILATLCVVLSIVALPARAATILKLNLGNDLADDIQLNSGLFSTVDDGVPGTMGYQNTAVEFTEFLEMFADIPTPVASFTLKDLTPAGDAITYSGWLVEQDFIQGNLSLYGQDNTLLLSADLTVSAVTGPVGAPGKQGLFLATGDVTGGVIAPYIDPDSLSVRMRLPLINSGSGFSVSPSPGFPAPNQYFAPLNPFAAGAEVEIRADVAVPEPAGLVIVCAAVSIVIAARRRLILHG
jgi:hypothetical protein